MNIENKVTIIFILDEEIETENHQFEVFFAKEFYKIINQISEVEIIDGACDYRLFSRQVVDDFLRLKETNRFSKGLFSWVGYRGVCLEFDHVERIAGTTKWSFFKLFNYAVEGITSFSNSPLRLATYVGLFIAFTAFLYLIYIVFNTLIYGNAVEGWSSTVCIILFLGGVQLLFLGVIGEYIGRIYTESKQRPNYIVKEVVDCCYNGEEGLKYMKEAGEETGLATICEVISAESINAAVKYVDMIQIGTRNMQNFNLLREAGQSGLPVMLKRGMAATIDEWLNAAEYIVAEGNPNVVLCERGIRTFETATRNTLDISAVPVLKARTHLPVIIDPSHASGVRAYVSPLAKAAVACGADGLMIEVHNNPACALSDGPQSLTFDQFETLTKELKSYAALSKRAF